jgi:stage II sporulation protein M
MGNLSFVFVEIKNELKKILEDKFIILAILLIAMAIGIAFGIFYKPTEFIFGDYIVNVENYYNVVLSFDSPAASILVSRIGANLGYFALTLVLSMSIVLLPFTVVVIALRGFVLGFSSAVFVSHFGFTGVMIVLFLIIPQNLITTLALSVFYIASLYCKRYHAIKNAWVKRILYLFVFLLISLAGAILEVFVLIVLFRPLIFYF